MDSIIKQDSYWFREGEGDEGRMRALCPICAKKSGRGWHWEGSRLGYGDYDLSCASCGNAIHLRGKVEVRNKDE